MAESEVMHGLDWLFAIGVIFFLMSAWGIGMFQATLKTCMQRGRARLTMFLSRSERCGQLLRYLG